MKTKSHAKLKAILATEASKAVIFRRGPSDYMQLIKWDTSKDVFEHGDWIKGRIYEDSSGISPDGERLIYVAADYHQPLYRWTAISRLPSLAPVVLWPNNNGYSGGGYFEDKNTVILNLFPKEISEQTSFIYHEPILAKPLELSRRQGIFRGWESSEVKGQISYINNIKTFSKGRKKFVLSVNLYGGEVQDTDTNKKVHMGPVDWADWDKNGDLLYSKEGKLSRWSFDKISCESEVVEGVIEIADFNYPVPKF